MGEIVLLLHRQRVHIRPEPDRAAAGADAQRADDAGAAEPTMDIDAERGEPLRHEIRRALFLEAELGMAMKIPPPCGHLVVKGADLGNSWHKTPLLRRFDGAC